MSYTQCEIFFPARRQDLQTIILFDWKGAGGGISQNPSTGSIQKEARRCHSVFYIHRWPVFPQLSLHGWFDCAKSIVCKEINPPWLATRRWEICYWENHLLRLVNRKSALFIIWAKFFSICWQGSAIRTLMKCLHLRPGQMHFGSTLTVGRHPPPNCLNFAWHNLTLQTVSLCRWTTNCEWLTKHPLTSSYSEFLLLLTSSSDELSAYTHIYYSPNCDIYRAGS